MAYENFTTYTEVDPSGYISVAENVITATDIDRDVDTYVRKDFTASHFGDIEHLLKGSCSSIAANAMTSIWMLTADEATHSIADADSGTDGIAISINWTAANERIYFQNFEADTSDFMEFDAPPVTYYFTVKRAGTTGSCKIYNDSGRTDLRDTLNLTLPNTQYRYMLPMVGYGAGGSATMSCTSEYLDLQEAPPPSGGSMQPIKYWGT
ncbi:hypothetical protein ES702_07289 [subsurface metagenome]